jgi:hypothetical protein
MNYLKLTYLAILFMTTLTVNKSNCKKNFAGKWKYVNIPNEQMYVVRTLNKQLEYSENGKYYYEFEIKWVNECKYEIRYKGTSSPIPAETKIGEITTVEILNIDKNKMKYHTRFRELEEVGEMVRIK